MGLIVVINIVMFALIMSASLILMLNSVGRETIISKLQNLGIVENKEETQIQMNKLKEEINAFPYTYIFSIEEANSINRLSNEERIMFYKLKKRYDMETNKAVAIIDLMKDYDFRYDYFISALAKSEDINIINSRIIIDELGPKNRKKIDEKLSSSWGIYKEVYLKGMYFDYLYKEKMDYNSEFFTEFVMGKFEAVEYLRRNETYNTILFQEIIRESQVFNEIQSLYKENQD